MSGARLRKGYDLQLQARPGARTTAWVAYSHQVARTTAPDPSAPATLGKEIENVPHYLWSAGVDFGRTMPGSCPPGPTGKARTTSNAPTRWGSFGQAVLLNVGATYRWSPTVDLQLQVKNLADRRTVYAWYDSGSSGFSPGDGRAVYASIGWRFQ